MATNNFILEDTAILNGGRMDESGKRTITKQFIYHIRDNSEASRKRAIVDLETLVPPKGSCMSDDARYTLRSAEWNCFDWNKESVKFYINGLYQRSSDDEESSAPWNLSAFNVSTDTVEEAIAFRMAYNERNERIIPVVNTAGDPIEAETNEILPQFSFSYYVQNFDSAKAYEFANTVNSTSQRIMGQSFPSGTLLIAAISTDGLVTYEDDGYTVKWRYTQINLTLRYNPNGWARKLLNIGNRAIFDASGKSELIYQYYAPIYSGSNITGFQDIPTLSKAQDYFAANRNYKTWLSNHESATNFPSQIPFEYAENIPLDEYGGVNTALIGGGGTYPEISFNEYRTKNWHSLDIPSEIKRRWR